jgi:hypothetical protein
MLRRFFRQLPVDRFQRRGIAVFQQRIFQALIVVLCGDPYTLPIWHIGNRLPNRIVPDDTHWEAETSASQWGDDHFPKYRSDSPLNALP